MSNTTTKIKTIVFFVLSITFVLGFVPNASAHELQTDGNIGAIFHTDPDDNIVTGQPTTFFLDFSDRQNKFMLSLCQCQVEIADSANKIIFSKKLGDSSQFQYNLARDGTYSLKVSGQPLQSGQFQSFTLNYYFQVKKGSPASAKTDPYGGHLLHLILILAALPVAYFTNMFLEKRAAKRSDKKTSP